MYIYTYTVYYAVLIHSAEWNLLRSPPSRSILFSVPWNQRLSFALHRDQTGRDLLQRRVTEQESGHEGSKLSPKLMGEDSRIPSISMSFTVQSLFVENSQSKVCLLKIRSFIFFTLETSKRILDCLLGRSLNRCLNLGRPASGRCSPCGSRGGPRWDPPAAEGCLGVSLEPPQRRRGGPPRWQPAQSLWGFSTGGPGRAWGLARTWGGLLVRDPSATWDDAPGAYNGVAKAGANGHTGAVPTDCEYRHCGFIDTERHILLSGRTWGSSTLTTCATSVDTSSCCHLNGCSKAACLLLHEALMSRFLPWRLQDTIDGWLEVAGLAPKVKQDPCLNNSYCLMLLSVFVSFCQFSLMFYVF